MAPPEVTYFLVDIFLHVLWILGQAFEVAVLFFSAIKGYDGILPLS